MVFLGFRRLLEAIQGLTNVLKELCDVQRGLGPAIDRLEGLERSRNVFEAECEGMLLKADGKLKAASAAEQRERQLKKANDKAANTFDFDSEETAPLGAPVLGDDAQGGEAAGVPPVRLALASNNKAHAVRTKWGI